jgi:hypothetical protein
MTVSANVAYRGWPNCVRLGNSRLEAVATTDVGPRIVSFGLPGGPNILGAFASDLGQTGGDAFRFYGGHRLQYSPEVPERIYAPDNVPVAVELRADGVRLTRLVETHTGVRRSIALRLAADRLELTHTLENLGLWPVELAPWALTIMAAGGVGIAPLASGASYDSLLPDRALALWPYTRMDDPRLHWGREYVTLRQDANLPQRIKFGLTTSPGWLAYLHSGSLFLKTFEPQAGAPYPDHGCQVELFADGTILELETLGPLVTLPPGTSVSHVEQWHLFETSASDFGDDEQISTLIGPLLERARQAGKDSQ